MKQHISTVLIRLVSLQLLVMCVTVWCQLVVCQVLGLNMHEDAIIQMASIHIWVTDAEFWQFLCVNLELSHDKYFWENIKASLHCQSLSNTKMGQVAEILPCGRQVAFFVVQSISWLLLTWRHKKSGHQQSWYWPIPSRIFRFQHRGVKQTN